MTINPWIVTAGAIYLLLLLLRYGYPLYRWWWWRREKKKTVDAIVARMTPREMDFSNPADLMKGGLFRLPKLTDDDLRDMSIRFAREAALKAREVEAGPQESWEDSINSRLKNAHAALDAYKQGHLPEESEGLVDEMWGIIRPTAITVAKEWMVPRLLAYHELVWVNGMLQTPPDKPEKMDWRAEKAWTEKWGKDLLDRTGEITKFLAEHRIGFADIGLTRRQHQEFRRKGNLQLALYWYRKAHAPDRKMDLYFCYTNYKAWLDGIETIGTFQFAEIGLSDEDHVRFCADAAVHREEIVAEARALYARAKDGRGNYRMVGDVDHLVRGLKADYSYEEVLGISEAQLEQLQKSYPFSFEKYDT